MSRFQGKPLLIPDQSKLTIEGKTVKAEGPRGVIFKTLPSEVEIASSDRKIEFNVDEKSGGRVSMVGLSYHLVKNMLIGVVDGFKKELEINGVGYRWSVSGNMVKLQIGFSYDVNYEIPEGISISIKENILMIEGIDKQKVGDVADEIRRYRPVEPYKGKGIRYVGEYVVRKVGKSGK